MHPRDHNIPQNENHLNINQSTSFHDFGSPWSSASERLEGFLWQGFTHIVWYGASLFVIPTFFVEHHTTSTTQHTKSYEQHLTIRSYGLDCKLSGPEEAVDLAKRGGGLLPFEVYYNSLLAARRLYNRVDYLSPRIFRTVSYLPARRNVYLFEGRPCE